MSLGRTEMKIIQMRLELTKTKIVQMNLGLLKYSFMDGQLIALLTCIKPKKRLNWPDYIKCKYVQQIRIPSVSRFEISKMVFLIKIQDPNIATAYDGSSDSTLICTLTYVPTWMCVNVVKNSPVHSGRTKCWVKQATYDQANSSIHCIESISNVDLRNKEIMSLKTSSHFNNKRKVKACSDQNVHSGEMYSPNITKSPVATFSLHGQNPEAASHLIHRVNNCFFPN